MMMHMPCNLLAEKNVLGILLISEKFDYVFTELKVMPDDFMDEQHQDIFQSMINLSEQNKKIDLVSVHTAMENKTSYQGLQYLSSLADAIVTTENLKYYIEIVKEMALRRKYIVTANKINGIAADTSKSIDELKDEYEKMQTEFDTDNNELNIEKALESTYTKLIDAYNNKGKIPGRKTGWEKLDFKIGGMENGNLIVVGGRPGMGKSIFAGNIAKYVTLNENAPAVIFSLEMPKNQVLLRMISAETNIKYSNCRFGLLDADDFSSIGDAMDKVRMSKLLIDDNSGANLAYIKSICRRIKNKYGIIGVVVVDYLQLVTVKSRNWNRNDEVAEISRGLKKMAMELNCPVIALSQLSRSIESREDKRPVMSDLRECGNIEQDADTIIMLYRDAYYNPDSEQKNIAEVIIRKSREGKTGTIKMGFKPETMKFLEVEYVKERKEG